MYLYASASFSVFLLNVERVTFTSAQFTYVKDLWWCSLSSFVVEEQKPLMQAKP